MTDEQWLRDGLADAVPEAPSAPDRAGAARERATRSRRRTTVATLAGAAAVAVVLAGTAIAFQRNPDNPAAGPAKATETRSPYDAPACPPQPRPGAVNPLDAPRKDQPDTVPEGATSVRLCQGPGTTFDAPSDALVTTDLVAGLVDEINGLRKTGLPDVCPDDYGPGYRLSFAYGDGSTFVVSGKLYGCRDLVVGSGYRSDGTVPWASFIKLLRAQRTDTEPLAGSGSVENLTCAGGFTSPVAVTADITQAVYCPTGGTPAPIPEDQLKVLVADMAQHTGTSTSGSSGVLRSCSSRSTIVAITSWGDQLVLQGACHGFMVEGGQTWTPGPQAQQILDDLSGPGR